MALDVTVYCSCLEPGHWSVPPPFPMKITVEPNGFVGWGPLSTPEERRAALEWQLRACPHHRSTLLRYHLGNPWHLQWILDTLDHVSTTPSSEVPVLRSTVVHSPHSGSDCLSLPEVRALGAELARLRTADLGNLLLTKEDPLHPGSAVRLPAGAEDLALLRDVFSKLEEMVALALQLGKPIAF